MKIHLKTRKTKGGTNNFYLEIYKGYTKTADGKIVHDRDFERLNYFEYISPKNPVEKQHNRDHRAGAEAVKAKRLLEIQNGVYGLANTHKLKANFIEFFERLTNEKTESSGNHGNWKSVLKHLKNYAGPIVPFKDVNETFIEGFREYLLKSAKTSANKNLATNAALSYFTKLKAAVGQAFEGKILQNNPAKRVKGIKPAETTREYLTGEEIIALHNTECRYEILKRAFLFSCLSGMRWTDVNSLCWKQIQELNGSYRVSFTQKKTKGVEYLDLPEVALRYLGDRSSDINEKVFIGLNIAHI